MKNPFILVLVLALSVACGDKSEESDSGWENTSDGSSGTTSGEAETTGGSTGAETTGGGTGAETTGGSTGADPTGEADSGSTGGDEDTGTTGGDEDTGTTGGDEDTGTTGGDEDTGTTGGDEDTGTTGGDETGSDDGGDGLRVGEELIIELPSNASTGYAWDLREPTDGAIVDLESVTYVMDEAPDEMSGVGGTEVFRFRAVGVGTTTIRLEYVRSWLPDESADTHTQEVTVIE